MASDSKSLLLAIRTKIEGATDLKSFLEMAKALSGAIWESVKASEKFAAVSRRAVVDIKEADKASGGLIDTQALYAEQMKIINAGHELTTKNYKALAAAAAKLGQEAGESGEEITRRFKQYVSAISKGSTEVGRELGIAISSTGDSAKDTAKILRLVEERYKDVKVEADSLNDELFKLDNNWGTMLGLINKNISRGGELQKTIGSLNTEWGKLNEWLEKEENWDGFHRQMDETIMRFKLLGDLMKNTMKGISTFYSGDFKQGLMELRAASLIAQANISSMNKRIAENQRLREKERETREKKGPVKPTVGPTDPTDPTKKPDSIWDIAAIMAEEARMEEERLNRAEAMRANVEAKVREAKEKHIEGMQFDVTAAIARLDMEAQLAQTEERKNEILAARVALLQRGMEVTREEIDLLGYNPGSIEHKQATLEIDQLAHEQFMLQKDLEIDKVGEFGQAFEASTIKVSQSQWLANEAVGSFGQAFQGALSAAVNGRSSFIRALAEITAAELKSLGIRSMVNALFQTATGIAKLASSYGTDPTAAGHFAAAAQYAAVGAVTLGVGSAMSAGLGAMDNQASGAAARSSRNPSQIESDNAREAELAAAQGPANRSAAADQRGSIVRIEWDVTSQQFHGIVADEEERQASSGGRRISA